MRCVTDIGEMIKYFIGSSSRHWVYGFRLYVALIGSLGVTVQCGIDLCYK